MVMIEEAKPIDVGDRLSISAAELCVIVPTFNECDNVAVLAEGLERVLYGIDREVIFVDDDSPDGTAERVRMLAAHDRRIRCIRRVGRRGLSSACIEGMLATSAPFVAVIDGDLQHDEALLPSMLDNLKRGGSDVVVASRYVGSGSSEGLSSDQRKRLSLYGIRLAQRLLKAEVAGPASGFFYAAPGIARRPRATPIRRWHKIGHLQKPRSFGRFVIRWSGFATGVADAGSTRVF